MTTRAVLLLTACLVLPSCADPPPTENAEIEVWVKSYHAAFMTFIDGVIWDSTDTTKGLRAYCENLRLSAQDTWQALEAMNVPWEARQLQSASINACRSLIDDAEQTLELLDTATNELDEQGASRYMSQRFQSARAEVLGAIDLLPEIVRKPLDVALER